MDLAKLQLEPTAPGMNVAELSGGQPGQVRITFRLHASGTDADNSATCTPNKALSLSAIATTCYEVLSLKLHGGLDAFSRVYLDVDYKDIPTGEAFTRMDAEVRSTLLKHFDAWFGRDGYSLTTSSASGIKISYHIVVKYLAMTIRDMGLWINDFVIPACGDLPECTNPDLAPIDLSVYCNGRKLRMLHSSKDPREPRPLVLVHGDEVDTLATYLPEGVQFARYTSQSVHVHCEPKAKRARVEKPEAQPIVTSASRVAAMQEIADLLDYNGPRSATAHNDGLRLNFPNLLTCPKTGTHHSSNGTKCALLVNPTSCKAYCFSSKCQDAPDTFAHASQVSEILDRHGIIVRSVPVAAPQAAPAEAQGALGKETELLLAILRFVPNDHFAKCAKAVFTSDSASMARIGGMITERSLTEKAVYDVMNKSNNTIGSLLRFATATTDEDKKQLARLTSGFQLESRRSEMLDELQRLTGSHETLCSNYIPTDLHQSVAIGNGCIILKSAMGTGKSCNFFMPIIKRVLQNPKARVCVITPRISYSTEAVGSFSRHGLQVINYQGQFGIDKRLALDGHITVIQAQSLHRLQHILQYRNGYECAMTVGFDLVVLDESESILSAMSETTTHGENLIVNWTMLNSLMSSPMVLAADAFLSDRTVRYLQAVRSDQPRVIQNTFIPTRGRATALENLEAFTQQLLKDANDGKRLYCVITSLKDLTLIRDKLVDAEISCLVHSSVERNEKALSDVNKAWTAVQVVLVTMTVTVGVNYDPPSSECYFDRMYVSASNKSCLARDVAQAMARPRRLAEGLLFFLIKDTFGAAQAQTSSEVMAAVKREEAMHTSLTDRWAVTPPGVLEVDVFNRFEKRANLAIFDYILLDNIVRSGFEIQAVAVPHREPAAAATEKPSRIPYEDIDPISSAEYTELSRSKSADPMVSANIQRYRFDNSCCDSEEERRTAWEQATNDETELVDVFFQIRAEINGWDEALRKATLRTLAHHEQRTLDRMRLVLKLLGLLGLESSLEAATVDNDTLTAMLPKLGEMEHELKAHFNVESKKATRDLSWGRTLVKGVLSAWSAVHIKTTHVGKQRKAIWELSRKNQELVNVLTAGSQRYEAEINM